MISRIAAEGIKYSCRGYKLVKDKLTEVDWEGLRCRGKEIYASIDWEECQRRLKERMIGFKNHPAARKLCDEGKRVYNLLPPGVRLLLESGTLVLIPAAAFKMGFFFPDLDIQLFGIRWHRLWAFHSVLGVCILKKFFDTYRHYVTNEEMTFTAKFAGAMAGAGAMGIALHLAKDALIDGNKSVVFGIPGLFGINTLVAGTWLDDDAFLLANSLWAFKISKDLFVLAFGEDYEKVRSYVQRNFKGAAV
ncbi:hypothetical protein MTATph1_CDS0243 [Moorella phage MTATph1]